MAGKGSSLSSVVPRSNSGKSAELVDGDKKERAEGAGVPRSDGERPKGQGSDGTEERKSVPEVVLPQKAAEERQIDTPPSPTSFITSGLLRLPLSPGGHQPSPSVSPCRSPIMGFGPRRPRCNFDCPHCRAASTDYGFGGMPPGGLFPLLPSSSNIVLRVCRGVKDKEGGEEPLRPSVEAGVMDSCEEEVATLMRRCWAEDPPDRPDFQALKSAIRRLNKSQSWSRTI